jgi:hypothetical protein
MQFRFNIIILFFSISAHLSFAAPNPCDRLLNSRLNLSPMETVELNRMDLSSFFEFARIKLKDFSQNRLDQFTVSPDGRWLAATRVGDEDYVLVSKLNLTQNKVKDNFAIKLKNDQRAVNISMATNPARLYVLVKQPDITYKDHHYNLVIYNLEQPQLKPTSVFPQDQVVQVQVVDHPTAMNRIYLARLRGSKQTIAAFKLDLNSGKLESLGYTLLSYPQMSQLMGLTKMQNPSWYVTHFENQRLSIRSADQEFTFNFANNQTESKTNWLSISNHAAPWIEFLPKSIQSLHRVSFKDHFNGGQITQLDFPEKYQPQLEKVIPLNAQYFLIQAKAREPVSHAINKWVTYTYLKLPTGDPQLLVEAQVWMRQVLYPNTFFGLQISETGEGELFSISH